MTEDTNDDEGAPLTIGELDAIRDRCRRMVLRRATMSGAVAATPLPFIDAAADVGLLLKLVPRINEEFRLTPEEIEALDPSARVAVYAAIKRLGDTLVGKVVTRAAITWLLKKVGVKVAAKSTARLAPLIGQATAATLSFWMMRNLGMQHVEDCYKVARARAEARLGAGATIDWSLAEGREKAPS